jgi:hypothetical protein
VKFRGSSDPSKDSGRFIAVLKAETEAGDLIADIMLIFEYQSTTNTFKIKRSYRIDQIVSSVDKDCIAYNSDFIAMIPNNKLLAEKQFFFLFVNEDGTTRKLDFNAASLVGVSHMTYAGYAQYFKTRFYAFGGSVN